MADGEKTLPRPLFCRDLSWDPFRNWPQLSRIFDQDFGMPPFLERGDLSWIESARKRLGTSFWPGYTRSPLFMPSMQAPLQPSSKLQPRLSGGVSEIWAEQDRWKINLDVQHFSPDEIYIKTKEGYLEIAGQHEERQDEHGFVSRHFTRKYKLPAGIDLRHISSSLSGDGVLTVEAPLPASALPAEIVIPIQVEEEPKRLKEDEEVEEGKKKEEGKKQEEVEVEAKSEETAGGEESGGAQAADSGALQSPPKQGNNEEPEGGDHQQQDPAIGQSETSVEHGAELQPESPEAQAGAGEGSTGAGSEETAAAPAESATEQKAEKKPADEEGGKEEKPREESEQQQAEGSTDAGMGEQGKPSDPAPEAGPQQDTTGEPVQVPQEATPPQDPQLPLSQKPQSSELDVPEQQEIEQTEDIKGLPEQS